MSEVPRPNPELMIIGDSLAQGCRSLSVTKASCEQSWAARIAQEQAWEFVTPDFPRPILFNLEDEVRRLDTLTLSVENFAFKGIVELTPRGADTPLHADSLGDLHRAINGRFTLNPSADPAFNDFTPLDWVR